MAFCEAMKPCGVGNGYWLTFAGRSGTGKTLLAKDIRDWFKRHLMGKMRVVSPGVVSAVDYRFRTWSSCLSQIYNFEYGVVSDLSEEYLAFIDDIGAEHDPRKLGVAKLVDILNNRRGKFTVMTTNLQPKEIAAALDTRIASRIIRDGSRVVVMEGKDWNLR